MKQMFVRASVVLGKRFEHNLAAEGGCVLYCGSLMPAAAASFCAFWVRCGLGNRETRKVLSSEAESFIG